MLQFLKDFLLEQELKKTNSGRQFVDWHNVNRICLIVPNEFAVISNVTNFISESEKETDVVLFSNDKLTVKNDVYLSLNKRDFNFLGLPKSEIIQKLKNKNYDIVICGDMKGSFSLKAITLLVNSKCKVGRGELGYSKLFDISISEENGDFGNFLKQALKYLSMIKAN